MNVRRPLFPGHGPVVIALVCGYELAALPARSPLPTITVLVHRWPPLGWFLLAALTHHWYVERQGYELAVE